MNTLLKLLGRPGSPAVLDITGNGFLHSYKKQCPFHGTRLVSGFGEKTTYGTGKWYKYDCGCFVWAMHSNVFRPGNQTRVVYQDQPWITGYYGGGIEEVFMEAEEVQWDKLYAMFMDFNVGVNNTPIGWRSFRPIAIELPRGDLESAFGKCPFHKERVRTITPSTAGSLLAYGCRCAVSVLPGKTLYHGGQDRLALHICQGGDISSWHDVYYS